MSYAASIYQTIRDGKTLLPSENLRNALLVLVPRFLYPQKPSVDADFIHQSHFDFGQPGHDTAGTPITDAFAHLHVLGIMGLLAIGGVGFGWVAKHLGTHYGLVGNLILIGVLPFFFIGGDSFAAYLADLRNVLLFLLFVRCLVWTTFGTGSRVKKRISDHG
jgi:hypothetical protein